jgi:DNA-binding MarR family transcriptional regulator
MAATTRRRTAAEGEHFDPQVPGIDYGVLDRLVGYGVRRAQLAIHEDFIAALAPWNITPPRFSALVVIARNPGLKLSLLAQILGIARSGGVLLVDALQEMGYVERRASEADRRAWGLGLTEAGRRELKAITAAVSAHDRRMSRMLDEAQKAQLVGLLKRVAGVPI